VQNDAYFQTLNHLQKVKAKLFAHREQVGEQVGVRLDIPSSQRGIEVVAVHERPTGGVVVGYDHSATVEEAKFHVQPAGARKVGAEEGNKFPFAYIGGKLTAEQARREGVRIIYNPRHVHLFVEAETMRAVKSARKVYQFGKETYAIDPVFFEPNELPEVPEGMNSRVAMPVSA
jgi:hypothetical protein